MALAPKPPTFALADTTRLPWLRQSVSCVAMTLLTVVASRLELPLEPVPVTGQVMVVLLAGALLGPRWGVASQALFLLMGAAGAPVFAGGKAGPMVLAGTTGGYLVGFPLAALLAGLAADWAVRRGSWVPLAAGCVAGVVAILGLGSLWLAGITGSATAAFSTGFAPFLGFDLIKAALATLLAWPLLRGRCAQG